MTVDDLMVRALADYYRTLTYATHADKDMIGKAFRAGWDARAFEPGMVLVSRAHYALLEERAWLWIQAGGQ
jgi:hypothetical protein